MAGEKAPCLMPRPSCVAGLVSDQTTTRLRDYNEKSTAYNELTTVYNEKSTMYNGKKAPQKDTTEYKE